MDSIIDLLPPLLSGAGLTIKITFYSTILAFAISFIVGFGRLASLSIIRWVSATYVEVIRGTSLLVQLFWVYFVLPFFGIELTPMLAGVLALGINYGAYGSEVVRSTILSIPKGQTEATIALNMSRFQRMRLVILPQAFLRMLPAFGNLLVELIKGTALVSLITLSDLTFQGMTLNTAVYKPTLIFTLLLILYFAITYPVTLGIRWIERRLSVGRL